MRTLERLARTVVKRWDRGDLAGAVRAMSYELDAIAALRRDHAQSIKRARRSLSTAEAVEIDDAPHVVEDASGTGVWISAHVWAPFED